MTLLLKTEFRSRALRVLRFRRGAWAAAAGLASAVVSAAQAQNVYSNPYQISTLAGTTQTAGFSNQSGNVQFNAPDGTAVDGSGNVYVADSENFVIRMVTSSGVVSTFAGQPGVNGSQDGSSSSAEFGLLKGIAIDSSGNLYVTDWVTSTGSSATIRKITSSGTVSTLVPTSAGLNSPIGIAVDSFGNLYVADAGNYVIRKVTPGGAVSTLAGTVGSSGGVDGTGPAASFAYPTGVAFASSGLLYVADYSGCMIRTVTSGGVVTTIAGSFGGPAETDGSISGGAGNVALSHPYGIAMDAGGNLFISDDNGTLIRELTASGNLSTLAGFNSIPGSNNGTGEAGDNGATFNGASGIAVDASENIYVADTNNDLIRKGAPIPSTQKPVITTQPSGPSPVQSGTLVIYEVTANGPNLAYQWYFEATGSSSAAALSDNGSTIVGSATYNLTLSNLSPSESGTYYVIVSNSNGSVMSSPVSLTVQAATGAPTITTQPFAATDPAGGSAMFSVLASGATSYQWYLEPSGSSGPGGAVFNNGSTISGANTATLTLTSLTTAEAGYYYVIVTNSGGSVTSGTALLTVTSQTSGNGPAITSQPQSVQVASGSSAIFSVVAPGATTYQWYVGNSPLSNNGTFSNTSGSSLLITGSTAVNEGSYSCVVGDASGTTASAPATLTVTSTQNPGRLTNLSINTYVNGGTGSTASPLTAGFVSGGSGTSGSQALLIRASGPALTAFGYTNDYLPDPRLTLYNQANGSVVAQNIGWGNPPSNATAVQQAITATGAFPWTNTSSADSGFVETLPENGSGYSANVVGNSGDSGQTIIEVYDDTANYTSTSPRLVNLSCLQNVAGGKPGTNLLTAGFVIGGTTNETVLIRADGPSLGDFGISNFMPDPELQLYQLGATTPMLTNAGWGGNALVTTAASDVFAFPYSNANSADSAIVVTLPPGPYTVQVESVSGAAGQVEIEVYEVP